MFIVLDLSILSSRKNSYFSGLLINYSYVDSAKEKKSNDSGNSL